MRFTDHTPLYYNHSYFWAGGLVSIILNIAIWAAIIWLIFKLVKHFSGASSHSCCSGHGECCATAEEEQEDENKYLNIAKMRYAKGEIDKKHFDELKKEFSPSQREEMREEVEEEKIKE